MRSKDRLKHTETIEDLAWDVFSSQVAGEPHVEDWGLQDWIDVCLNYLRISSLPKTWLLELINEVKKCKAGL